MDEKKHPPGYMWMDEGLIVNDYKTAAHKSQQITILAQLNLCTRDDIKDILRKWGVPEDDIPKKHSRQKGAKDLKPRTVKKRRTRD